jgi:2Fe-2S ferredoxin
MVKLNYIEHDGTSHSVEIEEGMNLMEGATLNMVPGVEGMCGGICSCGTCHCYLPEGGVAGVPAADAGEEAMLEFVLDRRPTSRLGCQVRVTRGFDGLQIRLPKAQGTGS